MSDEPETPDADGRNGALTGLRVVEWGDFVAAPYGGKLLADLGAEVIKVEPPEGDPARRFGPFHGGASDPERSGLFLYLNANKLGVTIDPATSTGREQFHRLLSASDVLITDRSVDQLDAHGLRDPAGGDQAVGQLVVAAVSSFGLDGPFSDRRGGDLISGAMGGMSDSVGDPHREPLMLPCHQSHLQAGAHAAAAVLTALFARDADGLGQFIDIAETDIWGSYNQPGRAHIFVHEGRVRRRAGHRTMGFYPLTILPCRDGYVSMIAGRGHQWKAFLELVGDGELPTWYAKDPRFEDRLEISRKHADEMDVLLSPWLMRHTKEEIFAQCQAVGIPFAPVYSLADVLAHPHLRDRGYFVEVDHPVVGRQTYPGAPYRLSDTPWRIRRPTPTLGEHNDEVLGSDRTRVAPEPAAEASVEVSVRDRLPLEGIRVVDFGWVYAAPIASRTLADMGAEVIKIETGGHLDELRTSPSNTSGDIEQDPVFHDINRNKLSVTVNFSTEAGAELVKRLVAVSDVVIENYSPGVLDKYGLGYKELSRVRPEIVMASMSAAGQDGPLRDIRTYGPTISALSGLDSMVGYPGERVLGSQGFYPDMVGAIHGVISVLAAVRHRRRTGRGQHIDLSQWEATVGMLGEALLEVTFADDVPGTRGNRHRAMSPHGIYPCADDQTWIAIQVEDDSQWSALVQLMGEPAWAGEPWAATAAGRIADADVVDRKVAAWTRDHDRDELVELLQDNGVPAGPNLHVGERYFHEHFMARGFHVDLDHPATGTDIVTDVAWRLGRTPGSIRRHAPLLGEHTQEVFGGIVGLSDDEIDRLRSEGVLA